MPVHAQKTDSLLNELNKAIDHDDVYVNQKRSLIRSITKQISYANTPQQKYAIYDSLYNQYKSFSYDSAYYYAKKLRVIAAQLNTPFLIASTKTKLAFTLLSSGLFKETLDELNGVNAKALPGEDKIAYYFLKARCFFDLSDYNRSVDYSAIYNPKGIKCIDSALVLCTPGTLNYLQLKGLRDLRTGNYADGIKTYRELLSLPNLSMHDFAINASSLSYLYEKNGLLEESLNLQIRSAIADIKSATKETVSLYKVADVIYRMGDTKNAYGYIRQAMADATFYGALQRQAKISTILPIIEAQRISEVENQRRRLYIYASVITLLVLFVIAFAFIISRQLKKLRAADDLIKSANILLQENNHELEELNRNLSTANKIKNEYISYYFNVNSVYIEKLENFQKSLEKKLGSQRYDDALSAVKNLNLENERAQLFNTFDEVFLRLFPDFIAGFNALFDGNNQIAIPDGQLLGTEHRIFALIRMGFHDTDRIAKLLGYSVNTIYAYKNRIKNKSFIANDEFENRIMQIEAV